MAGVIFNLSGPEPRERYSTSGTYSFLQERPPARARGWGNHEKALADYLALQEGDLVFFFENRAIYGVGRIVQLRDSLRSTLCNYPYSWDLSEEVEDTFLWDNEPDSELANHPFVVFFEPDPAWYLQGIDMDEALTADTHAYVHALPFFWRTSFIRLDDFEAAHLAGLIRRANRDVACYPDLHGPVHARAQRLLTQAPASFDIDIDGLVRQYADRGVLRHEDLLEAWLVDAFSNRWELVAPIIERPEPPTFVGRQVVASPYKPPQYVDKIDLLAYEIERPTPGSSVPIAHSYHILELKKDRAAPEDITQALKYVDWVAHKRQGGDYADISAFVVSAGFPDEVRDFASSEGQRDYVRPRRPYVTATWQSLYLIEYSVATEGAAIRLRRVAE